MLSSQGKTKFDSLISNLERLVNKRELGALANLRKGLTGRPGDSVATYRHVLPYLPDQKEWTQETGLTIAPLFALWHQGKQNTKSGGLSLGEAMCKIKSKSGSIEQRFNSLLSCHPDDLHTHLRSNITLLKSNDINIDWRRLAWEIGYWSHPEKFVQKRWASDFWKSGETSHLQNDIPSENKMGGEDD